MMNKKIGILGGTFDPIHYGHLLIAQNALYQHGLDCVLFMPNGNPPHKTNNNITDVSIRCTMIENAIASNDKFILDAYEATNKSISYTYETLQYLKKRYKDAKLYFIMGADSLNDFHKWRNPDVIAENCIILAAAREQCDDSALQLRIEKLKDLYNADIRIVKTVNFFVSSQDIRRRVSCGEPILYLLPNEVIKIIELNSLYLDS